MHALDHLLAPLKIEANVFHNGQYCGNWAIDTSGSQKVSFHVVSHGHCFLSVGDDTIELTQGDAVFFPKDAQHCMSNTAVTREPVNTSLSRPMNEALENDGTGLVCGNFSNQHPLFDQLLEPLPDYILIRADQHSASNAIINMIIDESRAQEHSESLLLSRLSDCLFYYLLRDHLDHQSGAFAASIHPKLSKAMAIIHQQLDVKLTVDTLASAAGMSRSSFASQFKATLGMSPMDYVTQWRMLCAYRWLSDEQISTLEAAMRCGYENESSFSKAFSRVLGFGPGQVRSSLKSSIKDGNKALRSIQ